MLKLWDSYSSIEDYLEKAERNGHTFALTKITPEQLDNEQTMNYQFLQSLELDDEDIYNLIKPTLDEIDDTLPKCGLITDKLKSKTPYMMSNSFAFGGNNASIIIGKV